ncbi:predicted protein [Paecilomyces variotii No. 5]|uniref:Uncharacterized protein n=1 Tax=Byssochlamys spectabilis (strain No. 5 / NBRC 109023) TaxID=1356009 RepID=V5HSN9_BYSSN|nr:predicted protein [Paecilomyces variotii No. 5]
MAPSENRVRDVTRVNVRTWDLYDKLWCLRGPLGPAEYQRSEQGVLLVQMVLRTLILLDLSSQGALLFHYTSPSNAFTLLSVPETEPTGLSRIAYHCIETLKHILEHHPLLSDAQRVNIFAVLEAYRNGTLDPKPGDVTYWYAGVLKEDPGPQGSERYAEAMDRWEREHGDTCLWIEPVEPVFDFGRPLRQ